MPRALIDCQVNPSTVNYSQFSDGPNRVNDDWRASERYQSVAASIFDNEDRDFELFKTQCLTYVKAENLPKLKELIAKWKNDKKAISLDFRDDGTGNTPAIIAASRNNRKILQLLLEQNADITLRNNQCKTALQLANRDLQSLMLSGKLHVDLKHAAWQGNIEAVKNLLQKDVDVNVRNLEGMTPLLLATRDINFFEALDFMKSYEPLKVVKALLQRNVDVTLEDFDGKSTLHHLVQNIGFVTKEITKQLLGKTTEINQRDKNENSPLHTASKLGDVKIVEMLLNNGADVSCKNIAGKTPLHFAVIQGHDKVAELLLHHGADQKSCDDRGLSALDIAKKQNNKHLIKILRRQTQEELKTADAGSKLKRQRTVYSDAIDGAQTEVTHDLKTNFINSKTEQKSLAIRRTSNEQHIGSSEEERSELSETRESTFEYKVRPLEYHARQSLHSPRKSAARGNSAKISSSLPESLFSPVSTVEIFEEDCLTRDKNEQRKQSTSESLPNLKLGAGANKAEEQFFPQVPAKQQTRLPSLGDSPTRKTFRERLLSGETSPKAKNPKELLGTEFDPSLAHRERLTSLEGTPRVKNPGKRLPSLDSLPHDAGTTKKVLFDETPQQSTSSKLKTEDRKATRSSSSKLKAPGKNSTQNTSPKLKAPDKNSTQDTSSKFKTREIKETQNTSSKPYDRNLNQDTSFNRTAKNYLPSPPDSPKKASPYIPSSTQLPTRTVQSGVTLQKYGPDLSFVFEEKNDEILEIPEHQQNIQDEDSCLNEEAAVPIHSLLLELRDFDNTSQVNNSIRKASGVSRRPSGRTVSAASSKSTLSRRTSGGEEISREATGLEKSSKQMASNKPSSSRKYRKGGDVALGNSSGKTDLVIGKDFMTGFEAMQKLVDEYENAENLQIDKFNGVRESCENGFIQASRRKLLPRGSSGEVLISDSKLPLLPNVHGPSYAKKDDSVVLIPDLFVKSPESSPTKEMFPSLTGDKTSKENIHKQNVAFMDDVKRGKARENIVEDLFEKRNDLNKPKSRLAVPKNFGCGKKPQKLTRNCSAGTKKACSSIKMPKGIKKIEKPYCNGKGKKSKKESAGQKQNLKSRKPEEMNLEFLSLLPGFENCLSNGEFKDMFVYDCFTSEIGVSTNGIQEVRAAEISRPQPSECNILPEKCSESPKFSDDVPGPCNRRSSFNERYKSLLDFYDDDLGQERSSTGGRRSSFDFKLLGVSVKLPELSIVNELSRENIFGTEQGEFDDDNGTENQKMGGVQGGSVENLKGTPATDVLTSISIDEDMNSVVDGSKCTEVTKSEEHEDGSAKLAMVGVQEESDVESSIKEKMEFDLNDNKNCKEMTESTVAVQEDSDVESNLKEKLEVDLNNNNNFREMTEIMFAPDIDIAVSTGSGRRISNCSSIMRSSISTQTSTDGSECGDEELYDWVKGNMLDQGAYGTVYLALTGRGKMVAVKQVVLSRTDTKESEKQYKKLQEEIQMLKCLTHRYIVKFIGTTMEDNAVNIFMEYVPGGSLALVLKRFGPLPEKVFRRYTRQIVSAIAYLHYNGIVHRDIKGANIMLTSGGVVKLIDFGCAKRLNLSLTQSSQLLHSCKGTPYWMAPEVIRSTGHNRKSDIWSIGCTVFEMATGKPPWYGCPYAAMYAIASEDTTIPTLPDRFSEAARDFVATCLKRNPDGRCSAEELQRHEFISMNCRGRKLPSLSYTH